MLFSLPILLALPLLVPVQTSVCDAHKDFRTAVNYELIIEPTTVHSRYSRKHLTRNGAARMKEWVKRHKGHAWLSSMGGNPKMHVNGTNTGKMSIESRVSMVARPFDRYGVYYCPYVKSLDVKVYYKSDIAMAREIPQGSCKYDAVLQHELKHHDTNVTVLNTLIKRMEADTPAIIDVLERFYVEREGVEARFDVIKKGVRDALDIYGEEMSNRREEFNSHVDSPDEYKRVSEMCRD